MKPSVLIGGTFDPLHAGHLAYLRAAKQMAGSGRVLCCVSDNPSKHQPLVPIQERLDLLSALGVETAQHPAGALWKMLEIHRPTYYVKGVDWKDRLPPEELTTCQRFGIEIRYTDTVSQSSSTLLADYTRRTNAAKLKAFETFVQGQKPAEQPWEPVAPYDFESRREIESDHVTRLWQLFGTLHVLDYGCGFGHLVRMMREAGMSAFGYEPFVDVDPAAHAWTWGRHTPFGAIAEKDFDVVICREVLEHLTAREVHTMVPRLCRLTRRFVYVTTRFTPKAHLLDCDGSDDLDPTHITMLNQDLLRTLFVLEGCTRRADLEAKLDHRKLGRVLVYEVPA